MTRQTAPAASRKRDRDTSTRALLNAGIEAFADYGYDAATTRDIASRAGLNEQLITRYFGGKAGLLVAIYEDFLVRQHDVQVYAAATPASGVQAEIEAFLLAKHAHFRETHRLVLVLVPRLLIDAETREQIDMVLLERATTILTERLIALQRQGLIRADVDVVAMGDSIAFQSFGASFIAPAVRGTPESYIIAQLKGFARVVARGLAPDQPACHDSSL